jgi:hypothetical protein
LRAASDVPVRQPSSLIHRNKSAMLDMPLKIGILIAGSLYWRDVPHRARWREQCLHMDRTTAVNVPIRYGRLSRSRTYTMVYAPTTPPGRAKVVPCKHEIASFKEMVAGATALWAAEQSEERKPPPGQLHSAQWGCVGLLPNPNSDIPGHLLEAWAERVAGENSSRNGAKNDPTKYAVKGKAALGERGLLQIPWPDRSDNGKTLDGFDLLLATATKPVPDLRTGDFASVAAIADAWNRAGNASYFHSNRQNGFKTFQDEDIAALLRV